MLGFQKRNIGFSFAKYKTHLIGNRLMYISSGYGKTIKSLWKMVLLVMEVLFLKATQLV